MELNINTITFGKYKNKSLNDLLKDRNYCEWLLTQDWFKNYEYLYNNVLNYNPITYFIKEKLNKDDTDFINNYEYFNLTPEEELEIELTDIEKDCYGFYLNMINELKNKILNNTLDNKYDIKAPSGWLQKFEREIGIPREDFKNFLNSFGLKSVSAIVEDIKKQGGIDYKGCKSFLIAKQNSQVQELFWFDILKEKYGDMISTQFKYENCIFDYIDISKNIIYECKLKMKDFNDEQYSKYLITLNKYKIIYLIGNDTIIDIEKNHIYTLDKEKYEKYILKIKKLKLFEEEDRLTFLDNIIIKFKLISMNNMEELKNILDF